MKSWFGFNSIFILMLMTVGFSHGADNPEWIPVNIERVMSKDDPEPKGSLILFKNGRFLKGSLYEVAYLGQLRTQKKAPYIILKGRGCFDCDIETALYIHSPDDGDIQPDYAQRHFDFPGKLIGEDGHVLEESRVFIGDCLPTVPDEVVWFQTDGEDNSIHSISVGKDDQLMGSTFIKNLPDIQDTLTRVKEKKCREIPGIDQADTP